jgi:hypothetical protein
MLVSEKIGSAEAISEDLHDQNKTQIRNRRAEITHHVEDADEDSWHVVPLRRWLR